MEHILNSADCHILLLQLCAVVCEEPYSTTLSQCMLHGSWQLRTDVYNSVNTCVCSADMQVSASSFSTIRCRAVLCGQKCCGHAWCRAQCEWSLRLASSQGLGTSDLHAYNADDCHLLSDAGRRTLRSHSNDIRKLLVPRTHNKFGDRSFSAAGRRPWNDLPHGLWWPGLSFDSFRRSLKMTSL